MPCAGVIHRCVRPPEACERSLHLAPARESDEGVHLGEMRKHRDRRADLGDRARRVVNHHRPRMRVGTLRQPDGPVAAHGEADDTDLVGAGCGMSDQLINASQHAAIHRHSTWSRPKQGGLFRRPRQATVVQIDATCQEALRCQACEDYLRAGDALVVRVRDRLASTTTLAIQTITELASAESTSRALLSRTSTPTMPPTDPAVGPTLRVRQSRRVGSCRAGYFRVVREAV